MHFDLIDLRLFVHVHQAGTLTAGARSSHMTLASASERIRNLEDSLGLPLLWRDRRGVRPTPAGTTFLQHALRVLSQVDQLQAALAEHTGGARGDIRLFSNTSGVSEYLPGLVAGFLAAHPGITIDLEEHASEDTVQAVRQSRCDLGLVSDFVDLAGLRVVPFRDDPLVLITPRAHPLVGRGQVVLSELLGHEFVGLVPGTALRGLLLQQAHRLGDPLRERVRVRNLESVCRLVGQGVGLGIVPSVAADLHGSRCNIERVALADPWAQRRLVWCLRDPRQQPPAVGQFLDWLAAEAA